MMVSVAKCSSYTDIEVNQALVEVLAPLGGLDWVTPGMKIAIKANLVSFLTPDKAATTHPTLLCALVHQLRAKDAEVIVGDSPGGLFNRTYVNRVYAATGMTEVEKVGARLNQNYSQCEAVFPDAKIAKRFTYTAWLDEADVIINFCKLKTHGMMGMSAAAKNMFGAIPGTMKPEYHYRFPDPDAFADMIVDLNQYFKPRLSIADAVIGMEGNGPTAGTPRQIGVLMASADPHALDLLCATVIGIDPMNVPTLQAAIRRGLVPEHVQELDIRGEWQSVCIPDYKLVTGSRSLQFQQDSKSRLGKLTGRVMKSALASIPKLRKSVCVGCQECAKICPAKAIEMVDRRPVIHREKCIRCFCCQEFCPKGAMKVHRPAIARLLVK